MSNTLELQFHPILYDEPRARIYNGRSTYDHKTNANVVARGGRRYTYILDKGTSALDHVPTWIAITKCLNYQQTNDTHQRVRLGIALQTHALKQPKSQRLEHGDNTGDADIHSWVTSKTRASGLECLNYIKYNENEPRQRMGKHITEIPS